MTSQVLSVELAAISQEAKRKFPEIRAAAEKSLQDLKAIGTTSEQSIANEVNARPHFIETFVLGSQSKNNRLASSSVICLQRLITINGLPASRLGDVLAGFLAACSLSLDVQLKVLQSLPSLVQNYAQDLVGRSLASALHVCASLLQVKAPTISAIAGATLQQLVVLVFDKVANEDAAARNGDLPLIEGVKVGNETVPVREAAFDAYRVFNDICRAVEGRATEFLDVEGISIKAGLELAFAVLSAHATVFASHAELEFVLKESLVPFLIRILSDKQSFSITLRAMRLIPLLIRKHLRSLVNEFEVLLSLLIHLLDPDSSPLWKRIMIMEVWRSIYTTSLLAISLYVHFDKQEGRKAIVRDNISNFVRLASENAAALGSGQAARSEISYDEVRTVDGAAIDAVGGMGAVMTDTTQESSTSDERWQAPKVPLLDALDKSDPPRIPDTYIYVLLLDSMNGLSESLAKVILPLTVAKERSTMRPIDNDAEADQKMLQDVPKRSLSHRSSSVPVNPLKLGQSPARAKVQAIADLLDNCWPALLATSSSFLGAALDNDSYRGLIRTIQRLAQVAGLLELTTARDAFLTTLGKMASPPNLLSSLSFSAPETPATSSPPSFLPSKGFLGISSAMNNYSAASNGDRRPSIDPSMAVLTNRNLQCLRALINLAIALGPTLQGSMSIILAAVQQNDVYLDAVKGAGSGFNFATIAQEIDAVSTASLRLLQSTSDFPNPAFATFLAIFCHSIADQDEDVQDIEQITGEGEAKSTYQKVSKISFSQPGSPLYTRNQIILLSKLACVAESNLSRFLAYPPQASRWQDLLDSLLALISDKSAHSNSRLLATDIICTIVSTICRSSSTSPGTNSDNVQKMVMTSLDRLLGEVLQHQVTLDSFGRAALQRILAAAQSIVDNVGDSLTSGWDVILRCIASAFQDSTSPDGTDIPGTPSKVNTKAWLGEESSSVQLHSIELGRAAFGILQVIFNDMLRCIPAGQIPAVADLLLRFSQQELDLNMCLTTINLFSTAVEYLTENETLDNISDLVESPIDSLSVAGAEERSTNAMQWLLFIDSLSKVATDHRPDLRTGAFQTLLRLLSNQNFEPNVFEYIFTSILLKVLWKLSQTVVTNTSNTKVSSLSRVQDPRAAKLLLEGISTYLANNLDIISAKDQYSSICKKWLELSTALINAKSFILDEAVYSSLATVLGPIGNLTSADASPLLSEVKSFWIDHVPGLSHIPSDSLSKQAAYLAYAEAGKTIMRLAEDSLLADDVAAAADRARACIENSQPENYGSDEMSMTRVQASMMQLLDGLSLIDKGSLLALLKELCAISEMPFSHNSKSPHDRKRLTFVAVSKASMIMVETKLTAHKTRREVYASNIILRLINTLNVPMRLKYNWSKHGREPSLWKQATACVLAIISCYLNTSATQAPPVMDAPTMTAIHECMVRVVSSILHADYGALLVNDSSFKTITTIANDEEHDINAFLSLRSRIVSGIGGDEIDSNIRDEYCRSLCITSLIHPSPRRPFLPGTKQPLKALFRPLKSTVEVPTASLRENMSYLCLAELFGLVSHTEEALPWPPSSTHKGAYQPAQLTSDDNPDTVRAKVNLANAAFPWLLLRLAQVLKTYIADQPLLGSMPAPMSVHEELCWILERAAQLRCHRACVDDDMTVAESAPDAIASDGAKGDKLVRYLRVARGSSVAHLVVLQPLLVQAVGVAADALHGDKLVLKRLMECLDMLGLARDS